MKFKVISLYVLTSVKLKVQPAVSDDIIPVIYLCVVITRSIYIYTHTYVVSW
jgi:hypothetical protein